MSARAAFAAFALFLLGAPQLLSQSRDDFDRARKHMVAEYIEKEGVRNSRVLEAMRTTPRHEFVPATLKKKAYEDAAFFIGFKQTISPPFVVAYMTEALNPQPGDRVLEIGTGSGYQAAVLSPLVKEVYSIEIVEPLGRAAARRLKNLGYKNVKTKVGDGYKGWPEFAPFDKIIVTCSPENVPVPLVDQLKEGGRMIIPLGERYHQEMYLLEKKQGKLIRKPLIPTLFVPMTGRSEKERTIRPDPLNPRLNNGGFEELEADGSPSAWHYQRELKLSDQNPFQGRYCALFANEDRGRMAQALQGMALNGKKLESLRFTLQVRRDHIVNGTESYQQASVQVYFYDEYRRNLEEISRSLGNGTSDWQEVRLTVPVPQAAREAIVRIGLNGATGRLFVDDVTMIAVRRLASY